MSLLELLEDSTTWLAWSGLGLLLITLISFIVNWGVRFRLVGATVFTFLLSISCWAFSTSYSPPLLVEGAQYAPVVYDNGSDLVIIQASDNFPNEAIQPTLEQIAGNIKGGGRNGGVVHVKIRKLEASEEGISTPVILGEVIRDFSRNITTKPTQLNNGP